MLTEVLAVVAAAQTDGRQGWRPAPMLTGLRDLARAEHATLWLPAESGHPETLLSARAGHDGAGDTSPVSEDVRRRCLEAHAVVTLARDGDLAVAVTVLRSGTAAIGTLEIAGPIGRAAFEPEVETALALIGRSVAATVENARLVERLRWMAGHDPVTGLPGQELLSAALQQARDNRPVGRTVVVVTLDLGGARHHFASESPADVVQRLRRAVPADALVARLDSGAMAVLMTTGSDGEPVPAIAERLRLTTGCATAGFALTDNDAVTATDLLDQLTRSARTGPAGMSPWRLKIRDQMADVFARAIDDHAMTMDLRPRVALSSGRALSVQLQPRWPRIDSPGITTGQVVAAAAERDPDRVSRFLLDAALQVVRDWTGKKFLQVAVSIPDPCWQQRLPEILAMTLREWKLPGERLILQFSGGAAAAMAAIPAMHAVRDLGVNLSVDATALPLPALGRLPVREFLLPPQLVAGLTADGGDDLAVALAIGEFARHRRTLICADGVTGPETLDKLGTVDCHTATGPVFGEPVTQDDLAAHLAQKFRT